MPGKLTGIQRTYQCGKEEGIRMYLGVTYGTVEGQVVLPDTDNAVFVGVVDNDERVNDPIRAGGSQLGRDIAVHITGYGAIEIDGNVAYGGRLILGAGGVAKAMPEGTQEVTNITVIKAPTESGNITIKLGGTDIIVALEQDTHTTAALAADAIATALSSLEGYTVQATQAVVTVTAAKKGAEVDATFNGGGTGAEATVEVSVQGSPELSGTYNVIGYAEKSGVSGDVIPFRIAPHTYTIG